MDDQKIFEAISNQELLGEVQRRVEEGLVLPDSLVGSVAAGSELDGATLDETVFKNRAESFIDPNSDIDLDEQLRIMDEFWQNLGMTPPELSDEQKASIADKLEQNPDKKVIPTPLLDLQGRQDIAERAKSAFPANEFTDSGASALWVPDESWRYGQLLRDPDGKVKDGGTNYALGFSLPNGEQAVGRTHFIDGMADGGQVVVAEDGTAWVYPVMDVSVSSPRSRNSAGELYGQVDPTVTPEANLTMQLLHQAAGTPNSRWHVDFANEAVVELNKRGNPKALAGVAGVRWYPRARRVRLGDWDPQGRNDDVFGVRAAESGLLSL